MNPKKDVDTKNALKAGDQIDWKIDTNIDRYDQQGHKITYNSYGITDPLSKYTTLDRSQGKNGVTIYPRDSKGNVDTTTLFPADDYTVTIANTTDASIKEDYPTTVTVALNSDGINAISSGTYAGLEFVIHVTTNRDNLIKDGKTNIDNTANVNNNGNHQSTPTSSKPVFGDLTFDKVDATDPSKKLGGATFELYRRQGNSCGNGPITGQEYMTATSSSDTATLGQVTFNKVLIGTKTITYKKNDAGDWIPSEPADDTVVDDFCLVETKAPDGYVLDKTKTYPVVLKGGATANKYNDNDNYIKNTKPTGPQLPLTGAAGRLLLILGAIAILAAAAALYVVNKRRQNANANR